jgi:hypothetical protein
MEAYKVRPWSFAPRLAPLLPTLCSWVVQVQKRLGVGTYGSAYLVSLVHDPSQLYCLKKVKLDEGALLAARMVALSPYFT